MRNFAWPGSKSAVLPLATFLLALIPRLTGLGHRPFWYDEILTVQRASMPVAGLIHDSFINHHTPLYFLLISPLAHLPDQQFWLRLPSAILGALNVMLVFLIAARAGGVTAGIAAALILGLSPAEIAFSQEARSYMLVIFFILAALHALSCLALNAEQAALPWRSGGQAKAWLQFTASSAAACCTLADGLPWLLAAAVTAAIMIARAQNRLGLLRNFSAANAIILACCLPLYVTMTMLAPGSALAHIPAPTTAALWYDVETIYLMRVSDFMSRHFMAVPTPPAITAVIGAGLVIAALAGFWRLRRNPMAAALLPAAFTLPVFSAIVSIWKPIVTGRYLLWSGPPFAILAGIGAGAALSNSKPVMRNAALAATAVLLLINLIPFYNVETKPRWDLAAKIFASQAQLQDVAYYSDPGAELTMHYYLPRKLQPYLLNTSIPDLQHARQARAQGKRLWVFYGDGWNRRVWTNPAAFEASLAPLGTPSEEIHVSSRVIMWRYDPPRK